MDSGAHSRRSAAKSDEHRIRVLDKSTSGHAGRNAQINSRHSKPPGALSLPTVEPEESWDSLSSIVYEKTESPSRENPRKMHLLASSVICIAALSG